MQLSQNEIEPDWNWFRIIWIPDITVDLVCLWPVYEQIFFIIKYNLKFFNSSSIMECELKDERRFGIRFNFHSHRSDTESFCCLKTIVTTVLNKRPIEIIFPLGKHYETWREIFATVLSKSCNKCIFPVGNLNVELMKHSTYSIYIWGVGSDFLLAIAGRTQEKRPGDNSDLTPKSICL